MKNITLAVIKKAVRAMVKYNKKHAKCKNLIYNGIELVCECEYEKNKRS